MLRSLGFLMVVAIVCAGCPAFAVNILTNGNFETGNLNGWSRFHMVSCLNANGLTQLEVRPRTDDCTVHISTQGCSFEGTYAGRVQQTLTETGGANGLRQVVTGMTPGVDYNLSMAGFIRTTNPVPDAVIRLYWIPGQFTDPIPPVDNIGLCFPANFPQQTATLVAQWDHNTGHVPGQENWVVQTGTVRSDASGAGTVMIYWRFNGTWQSTIVFVGIDDVRLESTAPPCASDLDGDGVCDSEEHPNNNVPAGGSNMILDDSDGDGLLDGQEDSNRNGVKDANESGTRTRDTDGDQFIDGLDAAPLTVNAGFVDNDRDELNDASDPNPNNADTDADRYKDGYEAAVLGSGAVNNNAQVPNLGDVNGDNFVTSLDALIIQSLFLQIVDANAPIFDAGDPDDSFRYGDVNRDGFVTSLDALIVQSFFLQILAMLPL